MRIDMTADTQKKFVDFHWDKECLFRVSGMLQKETMPISELLWTLDLPIWQRFSGQEIFDLAPNEVMKDLLKFPEHMKRIQRADLAYPLLLYPNVNKQWVVLDGYHRLVQATISGLTTLEVIKIPETHRYLFVKKNQIN